MLLSFYKITLQLLRVLVSIYIIYYYGLYGILGFLIFQYSLYFLLRVLFGLHTLSSGDYLFVDWRKYNLVQVMEFETFDKEKIIDDLLELAIKRFSRLRRKVVFFLVDWFFKDVSLEEAKKTIKVKNDIKFGSKQEIFEYAEKLSETFFSANELPYEFILIEKKDGGGVVFFRLDHILSDGAGINSLNYSFTSQEGKVEYPSFEIPWSFYFYLLLLLPIKIVKAFYRHCYFLLPSEPSAFKSNKNFTDITTTVRSKEFNIQKTKDFLKSFGDKYTINEFLLAAFSVAIKKYHKSINKYTENNYYITAIPVNTKSIPKDFSKTELSNDTSGVLALIPLSEKLDRELMKNISTEVKKTVRDMGYVYAVKYTNFFMSTIYPKFVYDNVILSPVLNNLDLNISNIQGPSKLTYLAGNKMVDRYGIPPLGGHKVFVVVSSYLENFFITMKCDSSVECKPDKFIDILEEVIQNSIQ